MQMQPVAGWSPYAGTGQNVSKEPAVGRPTVACSSGPARLLLPFKPQTARAGEGGERQPADGQPRHCVLWRLAEVPRGKGQRAASGQNCRLSLHLRQLWFLSVMYTVICSL